MNTFTNLSNGEFFIQNGKGYGEMASFADINNAFATSLRKLEQIHGISGNALAKLLNMSQQTINLYENGKRTPNFITAIQIANAFSVTVEDMILDGFELLEPDLEVISQYPKLTLVNKK